MEEILKQILVSIQELQQGQQKIQQDIKEMRQEISDLRDSTFLEFQGVNKELGAMRDTQAVAMDKWNKSTDIMERVEILLNEREAERVAVDATLVGHEERITILEQRAG